VPVAGAIVAGVHPVDAVRSAGGAASRARVLGAGVTRRDLERAVRDRQLTRTGRGYSLPDAPVELRVAAGAGASVGCVSALRVHGVEVPGAREPVHLVVASSRPVRGAVVHRGVRGTAAGLAEAPLAATVRALRCLDRHRCLAVVDGVVRSGLADLDQLTVAVGTRPGPAARWILAHADPRSESVLESLLRALLVDAHVGGIDLQVDVAGVGRVDILIGGWLVVEADGFASHADREHYRNDRRRLDAQLRCGLVTLWFSFEDVLGAPEDVVATVSEVLRRRRRRVFRLAVPGGAVRDRQWTGP